MDYAAGFNAFEIHPVRQWHEAGGSAVCEVMDRADIGSPDESGVPLRPSFWSVYGHTEGKGLACLADCETEEAAEFIRTALYCMHRIIRDAAPLSGSRPTWNHAFDIAFVVESNHPEGEDITPQMFAAAIRRRVDELLLSKPDGSEMLEAVGAPFDTYWQGDEEQKEVDA